MNKTLYHLSKCADITVLKPRIPENGLSAYEETTTPRVCFSDSIEGCLSAIQQGLACYYVYIPVDDISHDIIIPSSNQVCDAFLTGEVWATCDVNVKCIGIIKTSGKCEIINRTSIINRNGKKDTTAFFKYEWIWIDKYEENEFGE